MGRKYEYATTSDEAEEGDYEQLFVLEPKGDGWEMCGSNVVLTTRAYRPLILAVWFWKREVSQ